MQLARNLYRDATGFQVGERSIVRKAKEILIAVRIERTYTKPEVLEAYLNTVPFLYNAHGIEMAARTYFDKSADKLDVLEAATLIGMLKGNSYYNPVLNPQRALDRRNIVLAQMVKLYNQFRCSIVAIQEVPRDETYKYGVIDGEMIRDDIYRVSNMVEKPKPEDAPSNLAIIGRYILTQDIFDLIRSTPPGKGGEIQITDALMRQAQQGCVMAYKFKGQRFLVGTARERHGMKAHGMRVLHTQVAEAADTEHGHDIARLRARVA